MEMVENCKSWGEKCKSACGRQAYGVVCVQSRTGLMENCKSWGKDCKSMCGR